jgi:DNA-binding FadR family transcriptional regulator
MAGRKNGEAHIAGALAGAHLNAQLAAIPFDRILEFTNPLEVIEVRLAIEPVVARLAALRASQADIRRLEGLVAATKEAADPLIYEKADEQFHRAVAEIGAQRLVSCRCSTSSAPAGVTRPGAASARTHHCFKRQSVHSASHQEIFEAIAARNSEKACRFACIAIWATCSGTSIPTPSRP